MGIKDRKTLYARELNIIYETKFDKFRRKIIEHQIPILLFLVVFLLISFNMSPLISSAIFILLIFIQLINILTFEDKNRPLDVIGVFNTGKRYFYQIGRAVTSIEDVKDPADTVKNPKKYKNKILYPILVDEKMPLTHMFVVGTTGAGKTTFLINILEQILDAGSGCLAVDGKGDATVYEAFYNTAVNRGREDDFQVINFNVPSESNTFNPLLKGTADEITDVIGNMLDTSGENGFWAGRALSMMKALLSILVPLRDADLLFLPSMEKAPIFTLSVLLKWIDLNNLRNLYFYIKEANRGNFPNVRGIDENEWVDRYSIISIDRLESYLTSVYVDLSKPDSQITESSSKQHGNSFLMWNEALDMLAGRFGEIFNTDKPTIDMEDVVANGRIVYVLLPALKVDPRSLSTIGKIILAMLKDAIATLLGEKISGDIETRYQSFAKRPRLPFWAVMDEYGSYAVEGFDNVLAQARSLKVSVSILVQEIASLKKTSEIEAQRLLGNTGIKVALKTEEQKTAEEVVEFLGKDEVAQIRVRQEKQASDEREIEVQEKSEITVKMLKEMTSGHGYILWAGKSTPMLVRYYEPAIAPEIPEFSLFNRLISPRYELFEELKTRSSSISEYLDLVFNSENYNYSEKPFLTILTEADEKGSRSMLIKNEMLYRTILSAKDSYSKLIDVDKASGKNIIPAIRKSEEEFSKLKKELQEETSSSE